MRAYVRDPRAEFMPKPGRLREMALNAATTAALWYARAKAGSEEAARRSAPKREPVDPASVRTAMADFRAAMDAKRAEREARDPSARKRDPGAPISAAVGETGVSDELLQRVWGAPEERATA